MPLSKLKEIQSKDAESQNTESVLAFKDQGSLAVDSEEDRHQMIAEAAYFRALARGFEAGQADEDWYAAEAEIMQIHG